MFVVGGVRGCSLGAGLAVSISSGPGWNLDLAVWSMTLCVSLLGPQIPHPSRPATRYYQGPAPINSFASEKKKKSYLPPSTITVVFVTQL
jgi:hypothetical protein